MIVHRRANHVLERAGRRLVFLPESMLVCELEDGVGSELVAKYETIDLAELDALARQLGRDNEEVKRACQELLSLEVFAAEQHSQQSMTRWRRSPRPPEHLTGLWMAITDECNLRCEYCSADYGRFGGPSTGPMTQDTAKKAIDMLFDSIRGKQLPETTSVMLTFVGGEPLLNYEVLSWSLEYAAKLGHEVGVRIRHGMNTNGTLLSKERVSFLAKYDCIPTVSLDGPERLHDRARKFENGNGSYDGASRGARLIVEQAGKLRAQTACSEPEDLFETVQHLYDLGVRIFVINPVYDSPFRERMGKYTASYEARYMEAFREANEWLTQKNLGGEMTGFGFMLEYLRRLETRALRRPGCGAGASIAVASDGSLYPCQSMIGDEEWKMGSVHESLGRGMREQFYAEMIRFSERCADCYARPLCGASCYAIPYRYGELDRREASDRCTLYKCYVDEAIWMYYRLKTEAPGIFASHGNDMG